MIKIPLTRPLFDGSEVDMVRRCLDSGWVTQGPLVAEFERRFATLHHGKRAIATTSCTAALHLACMALGLKPGDEVIVPALTWVTSANCAEYTGARAVFADVSLETFNLDPSAFERAITSRTKAVVAVHLFGLPADMDPILDIARRHNIVVIEDAACAVGSKYKGRPVGAIGDIGCFSFHPRKVITTGEGGMLLTDNERIANMADSLRNHGTVGSEPGPGAMPRPYDMSRVVNLGYNLRMTDIQGAIGLAQLEKLDSLLAERKKWAMRYSEALGDFPDVVTPSAPATSAHTYQSYVIRIENGGVARRNRIMDVLAEGGIWSRPGTHAVHRLEYYRDKYGLSPEMFPNAVRGEDESITLPIYPGMDNDSFGYVIERLTSALAGTK